MAPQWRKEVRERRIQTSADVCRWLVRSGAEVDILGDAHRELLMTRYGPFAPLEETTV
jgi:hypothetical protein